MTNSENRPRDKRPQPSRHWRKWLIGLVVVVAAGAALALYAPKAVEKKLEGPDVRKLVSLHTANELDMAAGFLPLDWQGLNVRSEGLWAKSENAERAREIRAHGIKAQSSLSQWQSHVIRVKTLDVDHLELAFGTAALEDLRDPFANPPELLPPEVAEDGGKWATEIEKLAIQRTDLLWGEKRKSAGGLRDSITQAQRVGEGQYRMQGREGSLRQEGWPELKVISFSGNYSGQTLTIESSDLRLGEKAGDVVSITGHICDSEEGGMTLNVQAKGCSVTPLLPKEAQKKLTGAFTTAAEITREVKKGEDAPNKKSGRTEDGQENRRAAKDGSEDEGKEGTVSVARKKTKVEGKVAFTGATVQRIAALAKAAEFTGIEQFNKLGLDVLEAAYSWEDDQLEVKDFVLEAKGLLRMEGRFTLKNEDIHGNFELGVSSEVLKSFPGAEGAVFTRRGSGDYAWAKLRLTGSLDHPDEDLKPRLVAAAKAYYAKKFLAPILKPGKIIIEAIESLY